MKLGIVGLSGAGKTTVFTALTHQTVAPAHKGEPLIGTISVPDPRMDALQALYRPKKLTHTQIEYALAGRREALQTRVEMLHRHWTRDREYLPPPTVGTLANIDPALIVTPPPGLEAGYVPIVTRQAAE